MSKLKEKISWADESGNKQEQIQPADHTQSVNKNKNSEQHIKMLFNSARTSASDMMAGYSAAYPGLCVKQEEKIVTLNRDRGGRVALISGCGAGHEPFPAGFVGEGMLTASVSGSIFTPPPSRRILQAIESVAPLNKGGVLVITMNYTADNFYFGLAVEKAKERLIQISMVTVGEDVASENSFGRRGMCGILFVIKIAGSMSSKDETLESILEECRELTGRIASIGLSLSTCSFPGHGPVFRFTPNTIDVGCGIHGKAAFIHMKVCSAEKAVSICLQKLLAALKTKQCSVCVFVSNLGGSSDLELFIVAGEVYKQLSENGFPVQRLYAGHVHSSLDVAGFQISLLDITGKGDYLKHLDSETDAPAWPGSHLSFPWADCLPTPSIQFKNLPTLSKFQQALKYTVKEGCIFKGCVKSAALVLVGEEKYLNELDLIYGDGDTGTTFKVGAECILAMADQLPWQQPINCLHKLSRIAEEKMGGTTGAVYSLLFIGAAQDFTDWQTAWSNANTTLCQYTKATLGDRTVLDVLVPACKKFETLSKGSDRSAVDCLEATILYAEELCRATSSMQPKTGRPMSVDPKRVTDVDAGCYAIILWLNAILNELKRIQPGSEQNTIDPCAEIEWERGRDQVERKTLTSFPTRDGTMRLVGESHIYDSGVLRRPHLWTIKQYRRMESTLKEAGKRGSSSEFKDVKYVINSPQTCVDELMNGICVTYPGLTVDHAARIVTSGKDRMQCVGVLSGGGSGHEPCAAGYVGEGMLTASVSGPIFAAPPSSKILQALEAIAPNNRGGVIIIVGNYTGDNLNFGLAMEKAREKGIKVEMCSVAEDVATEHLIGRRGMCGILFAWKIAGSMSKRGEKLECIHHECDAINSKMATMGLALTSCSIPGFGPLFKLAPNMIELGCGVHGEEAWTRIELCTAEEIISQMLQRLMQSLRLDEKSQVAVCISNLGATSSLEISIIAAEIHKQLKAKGVSVVRLYSGHLQTSLNTAGFQVCLLDTSSNPSWLEHLDSNTDAPAWPGNCLSIPRAGQVMCNDHIPVEQPSAHVPREQTGVKYTDKQGSIFKSCVESAAKFIINGEKRLNELDSVCGDGDTGTSLRLWAESIIAVADELPWQYPSECLKELSHIAEEKMGGTSGAIYSLLLVGAAKDFKDWQTAWSNALAMLCLYSKAKLGDRTLVDVLQPACEKFENLSNIGGKPMFEVLEGTVQHAEEMCKATAFMVPKAGRATYIDPKRIKDVDAGAYGVVLWLEGILWEMDRIEQTSTITES